MQPLTFSQTQHILYLLDSGESPNQISASTGLHQSTISRIRSKHRPGLAKPSSGRPSLLSSADTRYAIRLITTRKAENASQVAKSIRHMIKKPVSTRSIRRYLHRAGMKAVVKTKRPLLKPCHHKERLSWALAHKDWTLEDWKRVVWSDETKINRLGSDGRKWVWKKAGEG